MGTYLRYAPGFGYAGDSTNGGVVFSPAGVVALGQVPPALAGVLEQLRDPGLKSGDVPPAQQDVLGYLARTGAIDRVVVDQHGQALARARRAPHAGPPGPAASLRLHPHTFVLPGTGECTVMCPATPAQIIMTSTIALETLEALRAPRGSRPLSELEMLFVESGFMADEAAAAGAWEFHDALLHAASGAGWATSGGYGRQQRPRAARQRPRPLGEMWKAAGQLIDLPRALPAATTPFRDVLATRRSARAFSERVPSLEDIGALFDAALRTQEVIEQAADYEALHPYPSGGARDEIAVLLALADGAEGAALFAYGNHEHQLFRFDSAREAALATLRALVPVGAVGGRCAAAILFTADYDRVAAKYEAISYALMLRNVGAIYQTLSLAAHARGLASCALGGGWGGLETDVLRALLDRRVIVGAMLIGYPPSA